MIKKRSSIKYLIHDPTMYDQIHPDILPFFFDTMFLAIVRPFDLFILFYVRSHQIPKWNIETWKIDAYFVVQWIQRGKKT